LFAGKGSLAVIWFHESIWTIARHERSKHPDDVAGRISIAVNWAATEGWNPGLADDACFAAGAGIRRHHL
jgi:hypothetical protein